MNQNHEMTIQRLVDGELTHRERSNFLNAMDRQPDMWREVALAFVEDQVWSDFAHQSIEEISSSTNVSEDESKITGAFAPSAKNGRAHKPRIELPSQKPQSWTNRYLPRLMLTAAATMLAITLAVRWESASRTSFEKGPGSEGFASKTPEDPARSPENRLTNTDPYLLQLDDNDPVPLYSKFDQMRDSLSQAPMQITPALQKQFFDAGYQLQPDLRFISGQVPDGRSFIVPVQGWRIHSYVQ